MCRRSPWRCGDWSWPRCWAASPRASVERLGGLDRLVLNVGISKALPLARQSAADWGEEYAVNIRSHMLIARAALPRMAPGSAIVLVSSLAAQRAAGRNPAYESSKAA